ncbi:MAG: glycosyltransferase [Roseburia sp.]|nr:glycosyltransferase [Roseburia sp.]
MMQYVKGRRVLFITTKSLDYLRNTQEIHLIRKYARAYHVIGSRSRYYPVRILTVYFRLIVTPVSSYDTVFVGFAPQLVLPVFYFKLRKAAVVEDFFISMYDTLCHDRKKIKPGGLLGRFLHFIDRKTLEYADAVVCDTNAHGQYFTDEFHVPADKLHTLYLQADVSIYYPREGQRPEALRDKYIVLYFGSILPLQGVDVVLKAIDALKTRQDLYFYCIGPIRGKKLKALRPVSPNIEYIDWLPQEQLAAYIAQADLCLAGHFSGSVAKAGRTIPGKAYIYQAMKKPMILGDNPANHELFDNDSSVTFVEPGNARALANEILRHMQ